MIIRLFFIRFNDENFNNKREFILLLRVYLIKCCIFINDYIILYISLLKYKILILLKILSRFFFAIRYTFFKHLLRLL